MRQVNGDVVGRVICALRNPSIDQPGARGGDWSCLDAQRLRGQDVVKELFERRVVLVAGKGGVGRSTLAAAMALAGARMGRRVLLTEIEEPARQAASPLARVFGMDELPRVPRPLVRGVWGVLLQTERGTHQFLTQVMRFETMAKLAMRSGALRRLLHAAPSFREMGLYNHLLSLLQERRNDGSLRYDLTILDMPATGHALALTGLPDVLLRLFPSGPVAKRLKEGKAILNDPAQGAAWVVTLPETLPVTEALELIEGLEATHMPIGGLVANRVPVDPFTREEHEAISGMVNGHRLFGLTELQRIRQASEALQRLRSSADLPVLTLDEQPEQGRALVDRVADALVDGAQ